MTNNPLAAEPAHGGAEMAQPEWIPAARWMAAHPGRPWSRAEEAAWEADLAANPMPPAEPAR